MTDATDLARVEAALAARWPETVITPTLDRIAHLATLLGDPHLAYPVVHITGTNGKTSTSRMVEALIREMGLSTGLLTSPHLHSVTERIRLSGEPISASRFAAAFDELAPYLELVDTESLAGGGPTMSYFETLTGMAFAVFADAPVDAAVIEVGLGGEWDATNIVRPAVCVVTPIGIDHVAYLGDSVEAIAAAKAGIIKSGASVVLAEQTPIAQEVLDRQCDDVGVTPVRQGRDFAVVHRSLAMGGQLLSVETARARYDDVWLPLYGEHQAANAAVAIAATEAFFGDALPADTVRAALAAVESPGRLEVVRRNPTVVVDAAHNPHGAQVLATALGESFAFEYLVGVVSVMADKDVHGVLEAMQHVFNEVVVTHNGTGRAMAVEDLHRLAVDVFGSERVHSAPDVREAIAQATRIAADVGTAGVGIVVTGSVATAAAGRAAAGMDVAP